MAACSPRDSGHASGTLEGAAAILAQHPEIATSTIHTAAILGDDVTVRRFLARDPGNATAKGSPHGWDALTYLCFSRYLRIDRGRSGGFIHAATALLDAGASANTGWPELEHEPSPAWESALYGAAGVAHHAGLTRLLLERGADPNDGETTYHAPEGYDLGALKALVECGRLTADSLATMLLRKHDWHDRDGVAYLLTHGADPNRMTPWGVTPLHAAVRRDNDLGIVELLLDRGGDPTLPSRHSPSGGPPARSAISTAARRGRGDLLAAFATRGFPTALEGVERLIAGCAVNAADEIHAIQASEPGLVADLIAEGGTLLAVFAANGNTEGVRCLLDLGVAVDAPYGEGDGYFGIALHSLAVHVAAWRLRNTTLDLLIARGSPIDAPDGEGRTPLALAIRACVNSYWTERRSPDGVKALLEAGASPTDVPFPSGYDAVDDLLRAYGRT